jgi:hypothetical protein
MTWRQRPHGMSAHSPHLKSHTSIGDVTHHSSNALLNSGSRVPCGRGKSSIHRGTKREADPHVSRIPLVSVWRHSSIRNTAMVIRGILKACGCRACVQLCPAPNIQNGLASKHIPRMSVAGLAQPPEWLAPMCQLIYIVNYNVFSLRASCPTKRQHAVVHSHMRAHVHQQFLCEQGDKAMRHARQKSRASSGSVFAAKSSTRKSPSTSPSTRKFPRKSPSTSTSNSSSKSRSNSSAGRSSLAQSEPHGQT